jgi:hypothetical protein
MDQTPRRTARVSVPALVIADVRPPRTEDDRDMITINVPDLKRSG